MALFMAIKFTIGMRVDKEMEVSRLRVFHIPCSIRTRLANILLDYRFADAHLVWNRFAPDLVKFLLFTPAVEGDTRHARESPPHA